MSEDKIDNSNENEVPNTKISIAPIRILYCAVCGLPAEYCEFGPNFDKCKPWLKEHALDLYPNLQEEMLQNKSNSNENEPKEEQEEVKLLPGGKIKRKEKPMIRISKVQRNKRKYVTVITGLENFGVKLSEAAKVFAKGFSCGASVVRSASDEEEIDIQGDIVDDLIQMISTKWKISDKSIIVERKRQT